MARICRKIIELGIIILIIFTPLFYGGIRLWTITLIDLIIVFLFFCWALQMVFEKKIVLVKTPLNVPILLFCGYAIISTIFFSRYEYASQLALHHILTFAALFFIVVNHLRTQRQLTFLILIIIANGLVHAILAPVLESFTSFEDRRSEGINSAIPSIGRIRALKISIRFGGFDTATLVSIRLCLLNPSLNPAPLRYSTRRLSSSLNPAVLSFSMNEVNPVARPRFSG